MMKVIPLLSFAFLPLLAGVAQAQSNQNEITSLSPESAEAGTTELVITFDLDSDFPSAPPAGVMADI